MYHFTGDSKCFQMFIKIENHFIFIKIITSAHLSRTLPGMSTPGSATALSAVPVYADHYMITSSSTTLYLALLIAMENASELQC